MPFEFDLVLNDFGCASRDVANFSQDGRFAAVGHGHEANGNGFSVGTHGGGFHLNAVSPGGADGWRGA